MNHYALYFFLCISLLLSQVSASISRNFNNYQKITLKCDSNLWYGSLKIAENEIGTRETGTNDGVRVRQYLRSVGLGKGFPYCQAGQYWSFVEYNRLAKTKHAIPILRTGSTVAAYNHGLQSGTVSSAVEKIGDLVYWKFTNKPFGHVERILEVGRAGWVVTVGFNTGTNARDGGGVERKKRNLRNPLQKMFLRGLIGRKNNAV